MLTVQQKAQCVLWYNKLKSPTAVQRKFKNEFGQKNCMILSTLVI